MFSGLDFTPSPELGNHQSKLLRCVGRPALSLFYFYRYRSSQIVKSIIAYFKKGRKPFRASPDSSSALKCGVFSGGFIKNGDMYRIKKWQWAIISIITILSIVFGLWASFQVSINSQDGCVSISIANNVVQAQEYEGDAVVYPPEIATDQDKLHAIYSLKEQLRLEHNRQGAIARSNPKKYIDSGIWKRYQLAYQKKLRQLLWEESQIKERLLETVYPTKEDYQKDNDKPEKIVTIQDSLFGDFDSLCQLDTRATCPILDKLRVIDLDKISPEVPIDPTEDLTTYTEVDSGTVLSQTSARSTWTAANQQSTDYLYYDKGVAHFNGSFSHLCDGYCTSIADNAWFNFYSVSTGLGTWGAVDDASGSELMSFFYRTSVSTYRIYSYELDGGTLHLGSAVVSATGTQYWFTIIKDEGTGTYGTFYTHIYSDPGRTTEITGSPSYIALSTSLKDYRYIYAYQAWGKGASVLGTGWIQNLDLQEAPVITVSPTTYSYGVVQASSTNNTTTSDFTIDNTSSMQTDQTISVTTSSWSGGVTWTHSDNCTPGSNTAGLKANRGGTWGTGDVIVKYDSPNYIYENCPATTDYSFGLSLWAPTEMTDGAVKTIIVRVSASAG